MSLPRHFPALVFALVQLSVLDGAVANHFILPCTEECGEPRWVATGSMQVAREFHTATLLPTGMVLVAGGRNAASGRLDSAELYDPDAGTWSVTGRMTTPRSMHVATLLPDGRVLVAGGTTPWPAVTNTSEVYDPATGTWTPTGSMNMARFWYDAALLQDGRVLVAGGAGKTEILASAELYDPATGRWTPAGDLNAARYAHTLTLLQDGSVLAVRGSDDGDFFTTLSSAERFDPHTGLWRPAGDSGAGSVMHTASRLPDGRVLIVGGHRGHFEDGPTDRTAAYVFDPMSSTWDRVGDLRIARFNHAAIVLSGGSVLVAGGSNLDLWYMGRRYSHPSAMERFDPDTSSWSSGADLVVPREMFTLTLLRDGTVLAVGGRIVEPGYRTVPLASAERYTAPANTSGSDHGTGAPDCEHGRVGLHCTTGDVPPP